MSSTRGAHCPTSLVISLAQNQNQYISSPSPTTTTIPAGEVFCKIKILQHGRGPILFESSGKTPEQANKELSNVFMDDDYWFQMFKYKKTKQMN